MRGTEILEYWQGRARKDQLHHYTVIDEEPDKPRNIEKAVKRLKGKYAAK
ncbi:hypothetical protein LCGC14_0972750 [marine sediment metagenome]|uniref:Uncharacterized protein n=1 Tax=marine sediment metagenome TaxID=412755 RepID=A0A0F9RHI4_9ZZZZ